MWGGMGWGGEVGVVSGENESCCCPYLVTLLIAVKGGG